MANNQVPNRSEERLNVVRSRLRAQVNPREWAEIWLAAMDLHIRTGRTMVVYAVVHDDEVTFDHEYQLNVDQTLPDAALMLDVVDNVEQLGDGEWPVGEDGLSYNADLIEHWADQCAVDLVDRLADLLKEDSA